MIIIPTPVKLTTSDYSMNYIQLIEQGKYIFEHRKKDMVSDGGPSIFSRFQNKS